MGFLFFSLKTIDVVTAKSAQMSGSSCKIEVEGVTIRVLTARSK